MLIVLTLLVPAVGVYLVMSAGILSADTLDYVGALAIAVPLWGLLCHITRSTGPFHDSFLVRPLIMVVPPFVGAGLISLGMTLFPPVVRTALQAIGGYGVLLFTEIFGYGLIVSLLPVRGNRTPPAITRSHSSGSNEASPPTSNENADV